MLLQCAAAQMAATEPSGHERMQLQAAVLNASSAAAARAPTQADARCTVANRHSQFGEDVTLLPTLLATTSGHIGTFVEIGANDGITGSNSLLLERCWRWRGLLIEANTKNFAKLRSSKRVAHMAHSGVCAASPDGSPRHIEVAGDGVYSGVAAGSATVQSYLRRHARHSVSRVPCRPMGALLEDAGFGNRTIDFLSLDVEGAEDAVLATIDPARFRVVVVELDGMDRAKDDRVVERLTRAGLRQVRIGPMQASHAFVAPGVVVRPPLAVKGSKLRCNSPTRCDTCCWLARA